MLMEASAPVAAPSKAEGRREVEDRPGVASKSSVLEINLRVLEANVRHYVEKLAPALVCCVLKADSYGHGTAKVAPVVEAAGVKYFAVADNGEGETIRATSKLPIMRCRVGTAAEIEDGRKIDMEEMIGSLEDAKVVSSIAQRLGKPIKVHVNLDTGMARQSFMAVEEAAAALALPGLQVAGVMTHFSVADADDFGETLRMLAMFKEAVKQLEGLVGKEKLMDAVQHVSNSAAMDRGGRDVYLGMVRTGSALFGNPIGIPTPVKLPECIKPVMRWTTAITQVRTLAKGTTIGYSRTFTVPHDGMKVASLPVGFGEGYPRALANKGTVVVKGRRCPVVGKVSMNVMNIDVTAVPDAAIGDEVVLIGEEITADENMDRVSSTHTEMQINVGARNRRVYVY